MAHSKMVHVTRADFRCHEDGDQLVIPQEYFDPVLLNPDVKTEDLPRIFQVQAVARALGRLPLHLDDPSLFSIEAREATYGAEWPGPPRRQMAQAGLFSISPGTLHKTTCAFCTVEIRVMQRDETPLERHRIVSPYCSYLKCLKVLEL